MRWTRWCFSLFLLPSLVGAEGVALTFDDLPLNGALPRGATQADIVKQVLPIFRKHKLPPVFGFINAKKLEGSAKGAEALQLWVAGGQHVGSHTYSHVDLSRSLAEDFFRDVVQNEPALLLLAPRSDWRWFRYPYAQADDVYRSDPDYAHENTGTLLEQHMDARKIAYPPVPKKPRKELDELCR